MNKSICKQGECDVHLKFKYEMDEEAGRSVLKGVALSDGTDLMGNPTKEAAEKFMKALRRTAGTENVIHAHAILSGIAAGMSGNNHEERINRVALMLSILKPQDELEVLLYGQFVALQEAALQCLGQAGRQDGFYHKERLYLLSSKLFAQVNATSQAILKHRSGGKQVVQVVHLYNEGQAIVAQSLSH